MCVVLLRLVKTKNVNTVLSFRQHWHLPWQNWAKFFRRDVLTLHGWNLPQSCASISSVMPLLNPSLKLIAKSLIVNYTYLERWIIWLPCVCQVAWRFGRVPRVSGNLPSQFTKGRQEWMNQLPRHLFALFPRKSVCQDATKIIEPKLDDTPRAFVAAVALKKKILLSSKFSRIPGRHVARNFEWGGANNNQASTFRYILPLVCKASSTEGVFFWRFYSE